MLVLSALLSLSGSVERRGAPFSYSIIDLGTLGGLTSVALDISEQGHVCGGADLPNGDRHGFFWKDRVMTDCGVVPGPDQTEAWGINNHDQVVGIASNNGDTAKAFIWQNGQISEIPPTNLSKDAFAINDSGQIVGDFYVHPPQPPGKHAYILQNEVLTDLEPAGTNPNFSISWSLNNSSVAVGYSDSVSGAFRWENGIMTSLGTLGGNGTTARDQRSWRNSRFERHKPGGPGRIFVERWRHECNPGIRGLPKKHCARHQQQWGSCGLVHAE